MQKEAPQNEASYFSHGLREAVFLFVLNAAATSEHSFIWFTN
jgi:hypothetical protein